MYTKGIVLEVRLFSLHVRNEFTSMGKKCIQVDIMACIYCARVPFVLLCNTNTLLKVDDA